MKFYIFAARELKSDFTSKLIMRGIKANFSHVGIVIDDTVYHATGIGVNKLPVADFLRDHKFIYKVDITNWVEEESRALGWCEGNLGKDYSETQYLGFLFPNSKWFNWVRRLFSDGNRELICSEFAVRFCDECTEISYFKSDNADYIDPKQFIDRLKAKLQFDL